MGSQSTLRELLQCKQKTNMMASRMQVGGLHNKKQPFGDKSRRDKYKSVCKCQVCSILTDSIFSMKGEAWSISVMKGVYGQSEQGGDRK
jgi:hypothetical protein